MLADLDPEEAIQRLQIEGLDEGRDTDLDLYWPKSVKGGGGGGSWSTDVHEFSNELNELKRMTGQNGSKGRVEVQDRYSPPGS